jgi:nitroreductase
MIREYLVNRKIPEELITRLIKNAHRAPSAGHTQVQEFIIVTDRITKKKLRKVAVDQEYVELAPVLIIVCSNTSRSINRYGGREFYTKLPKYVRPVGIICLGYSAETPEKLSRINISKLVHYEKW